MRRKPSQSPSDLYKSFREFLKSTQSEKPRARRALERSRELLPRRETKRHDDPEKAGDPEMPPGEDRAIWPGLLASLAFLYLWWIAAILFDLAVIWQHYVRNDAILERLEAIAKVPDKKG